jgi:GrpB-like predicted nucleotidyltransferase (UPF0157 family)
VNLDDLDEVLVRSRTPGPVTLSAYDPAWPARFAARAVAIRNVLGERSARSGRADVAHVGRRSHRLERVRRPPSLCGVDLP